MNRNNNIFNKTEIENKLKNFEEGKDYSVSPTDELNIKTYNLHNDKLRSVFRGDKVPVRITQEVYNGKDYKYRGHFEEGKDYSYESKDWHYGENYQGDYGEGINGNWIIGNSGIKWDEHSVIIGKGEAGNFHTGEKYWEASWTYRGKGNKNNEPKQIEPNFEHDFFGNGVGLSEEERIRDLKIKLPEWKQKLDYLESQPSNEKNKLDIESLRKDIKDGENTIRTLEGRHSKNSNFDSKPHGCCNCGKEIHHPSEVYWYDNGQGRYALCSSSCKEKFINDNEKSDLHQENQELRQELSEVKKQLTEVLAELKKLKSSLNGKDSSKVEQQIVQNEKLIKESENTSLAEVQEQVNKSQALMNELNTTSSPSKENGNNPLPYVIGGSAILVSAGIIGYYLLKKNKRK